MKTGDDWIERLPGGVLVRQGLADLESGRGTIAACVASIARIRLRSAGLLSDECVLPREPELELYRRLLREGGDAYSRYNALLRELASFEQALDHQKRAQDDWPDAPSGAAPR
jgi:hypothetical protein